MENLIQIQPPAKDRAYQVIDVPTHHHAAVSNAMYHVLDTERTERILKGYRRSKINASALIADFMSCNLPKHDIIEDDIFRDAFSRACELFDPPQKYRPVHFCDIRAYPWTISTSVEAPYSTSSDARNEVVRLYDAGLIGNQRMTFHNLYNYTFVKNRRLVHEIKEGRGKGNKFFAWNTAHARSHIVESDEEDKVRMVYGVPKLFLMVECMLLWPYFNFLRKGTTPMLWGYEIMEGGLRKLYRDFLDEGDYSLFAALDWKQFDKRVNFRLIDLIHEHWSGNMIKDQGYIPSLEYRHSETNPARIQNLWTWMNSAAKYTPVRLPDGSEWKRRHSSLASGMLQTQVLDSMINAIMTLTCLSEMGIDIRDCELKTLGDDSALACHEPVNFEPEKFIQRFSEVAKRRFGAVVNIKKSQVQNSLEGLHILGYDCHRSKPVRDSNKLLAQLAYPERYTTYEMLQARATGIAYASCGMDKDVYRVCKDVFEYSQRQGTGIADPSGFQLAGFMEDINPIDWSNFPTRSELQWKLVSTPSSNPAIKKRYWDPEIMLCEF